MRFVFFLFVLLLLGCDSGSPKKTQEIIKMSHKEIEQRFAANGVEAASYYDGKMVELTGTVNTIYEYGTVILVSDSLDA